MSYSSEVLADSPLAYYRFSEASGTTLVDSSGNGHDGSYVGTPGYGTAGLLVGDSNTCADFTGTVRATVPSAAWIQPTVVTAIGWINYDAVNSDRGVVIRGNWGLATSSTNYAFHLEVKNGRLSVGVGTDTGGYQQTTGTTVINAGTTYMLALTYDGATVKGYVNGVQDISFAKTGTMWPGDGNALGIGSDSSGSFAKPDGRIDEVSIYGTALSASRIAALYTAGTTAPTPTGTLTATLPHLTSAASGAYGPTGSVSATLPSLAGDIEGGFAPPGTSGDLGATLPSLAGSLSGSYALTGQIAATLPALSANLTGSLPLTGSLDAALPSLTASFVAVEGNDFLIATLPALTASIDAYAHPFVKVGTVKTNRGNGIRLSGSAVVEVDAPLEDDPPNLTTVPIHIITPTVPAPTLVNGRPQ